MLWESQRFPSGDIPGLSPKHPGKIGHGRREEKGRGDPEGVGDQNCLW